MSTCTTKSPMPNRMQLERSYANNYFVLSESTQGGLACIQKM